MSTWRNGMDLLVVAGVTARVFTYTSYFEVLFYLYVRRSLRTIMRTGPATAEKSLILFDSSIMCWYH